MGNCCGGDQQGTMIGGGVASRNNNQSASYCDVILDQLTPEERQNVDSILHMGMHGTLGAIHVLARTKFMNLGEGRDDDEEVPRGIYLMEQLAEHFDHTESILYLARLHEEGYNKKNDCEENNEENNQIRAWEDYMKIIRQRKAARLRDFNPSALEKWKNLYGDELDSCLKSGAIRILDATWLVNQALVSPSKTISRRQELPEEAFLDYVDIVNACKIDELDFSDRIRIICLSYMWLDYDHPDPHGWTLACLAETLCPMIIDRAKDTSSYTNNIIIGVFWDFASLHQKPRDETKQEDTLFQQGLEALSVLYSHSQTSVYKITETPPNYPNGYKVADNEKLRAHAIVPYHERGWPFTESCWSNMTASNEKSVDISKSLDTTEKICEVLQNEVHNPSQMSEGVSDREVELYCTLFFRHFFSRQHSFELMAFSDMLKIDLYRTVPRIREIIASHTFAPLSPECFDDRITTCSFTNKEEDAATVQRLYRSYFVHHFARAQVLDYRKKRWSDDHVIQLADILNRGYAPNVEKIYLYGNFIEEAGCAALAKAIGSGEVPRLIELQLDHNLSLRDSGVEALAPVLASLQSISLDGTFITDKGCLAIAKAIQKAGGTSRIECISLSHCLFGNQGCHSLMDAFLSHQEVPLQKLELSHNSIDDEGCKLIVPLVQKCSKTLKYLNLEDTQISENLKEQLQAIPFKGRQESMPFYGLRI